MKFLHLYKSSQPNLCTYSGFLEGRGCRTNKMSLSKCQMRLRERKQGWGALRVSANFHAGPPSEIRTQGSLLRVLEAYILERKKLSEIRGEREWGHTRQIWVKFCSALSNLKRKYTMLTVMWTFKSSKRQEKGLAPSYPLHEDIH